MFKHPLVGRGLRLIWGLDHRSRRRSHRSRYILPGAGAAEKFYSELEPEPEYFPEPEPEPEPEPTKNVTAPHPWTLRSTGDLWGQVNDKNGQNASSPITSYLTKLEPRFKDQNVPYGIRNTMRCLSTPYDPFFFAKIQESKFPLKLSFFFWVFYGSSNHLSTHMSGKRIPNSKSTCQITPGGTKTRKMTYDVIKGHWPLMTSVDLGKVTMSVLTMDVTSQHLFMSISPANIPKFASFRRWNGTERKFRLTWPWKSGHRSKVIVAKDLKFSGKV